MIKRLVDQLRPGYDFIVLDCPPTLGMITINALAAADSVIVPVQPEYLSVIGMTQLFDTVAQVQQQISPGLQVEGVLITLANMRTKQILFCLYHIIKPAEIEIAVLRDFARGKKLVNLFLA